MTPIARIITALALSGALAGCAANANQTSVDAETGPRGGMFAQTDANGDGSISRDEFAARIESRFARMDIDGNGSVTREERREARQTMRASRRAARFARIDADGNGAVSLDEMKTAASMRVERRFARLDADGDGALSPDEMGKRGARGHHGKGRHGAGHGGWRKGGKHGGEGRHGERGPMTLDEMKARAMTRFEAADANGDGVLSRDEARNLRMGRGHGGRHRRMRG